jgi:periplasmic protein TonB
MSAFIVSMPYMAMYSQIPDQPEGSPLGERMAVVGLVVLLHLAVIWGYLSQPETPTVQVNEMSISFANMQMPQAQVTPQPKPRPKPKPRVPDPLPAEKPVPKEEVPPAPPVATPPSPVMLDAEPDYRADYLNNPRPPYPLVARRMGYGGKVVLNVEVLAEGKAGQVLIYQSSGYDILDNAALQTVKTWRFTPASHLGHPVTQWFLVPIRFSLEDSAK